MAFWAALLPILKAAGIGAAVGAGGAKLTGNDWKKGAMMGAGLGGIGSVLPVLGGASAGGTGWGELISGAKVGGTTAQAAKAAAGWSPNTFGKLLGGAGKLATGKSVVDAGKQAAISTALSGAMPQYGQSPLLVDPGFMQAPPDVMAQLQQLMQR